MKHNIKVTVGLCVKNARATVKEAIDSILNQDFPNELMELIVVDGCSQDRTLHIIKNRIKNSRIKSRIFYEKKGLGYARQIVVDNAQGEYILWVDADTILPRDFTKKQVLFMERNPKVGIAKGKYGIRKGNNIVATLEDMEFAVNFEREGEPSFMPLGTSGSIYRVRAIKQIGGFDPHASGPAEDAEAEYRIKAAGWHLRITSAIFFEKRRDSWKSLWEEYFWHGTGVAYIFRNNQKIINIYKIFPPVAIFMEALRIPIAYRLSGTIMVFLLPFHYIFKRIAWFVGFIKGKP